MKKILKGFAGVLGLVIVGGYFFSGPLFSVLQRVVTVNMFISGDTDSFDPGLPVGAPFPAIRAMYQGQEITDIGQFIRNRGTIFIANRSVDW